MRRVLVVGPVPPPRGGIFSVMQNIAHSDLARDYVFETFARSDVPPDSQGLMSRNLFRARRFIRFFNQVRKGDYNFVHIHSPDAVFLGSAAFMLLSRLAGVKVLLHMHGTDWDGFYRKASWSQRLYKRMGLALPRKIVVLYQRWVDEISKLRPKADVRVLRNFVHSMNPPDPAEVEALRQSLGITRDNFVVLTVGWLGPNKGSYEILNAVHKVVSQEASVRFVLVGAEELPGQMALLRAMVEKDNLGAWVRLKGEVERDRVPLFYGLADIFLLPSFSEGMPMTIIEAMRSGLPIISTPVSAIPEMIEHGVSGWLINPGSPDEIAESVLLLKRDKALRQELGQAAKKTFEDKFDFSKGVDEIRSLYDSM
ncbi:MAG: glycosyltransferase family 4 protein [Desulfomonile tiedjei]|nr:glycosyltransferase family 4 protein [Desulfomonile tiedjei]